jgi:sterol desaturase/sphingolipid hydroxylase (fatty acid hydroxylase superfamily)
MMFQAIVENWQPLLGLVGFSLFWMWESWEPFFQSQRRIRHAARNVAIAIVNMVILLLIFAGITVAIGELAMSRRIGFLHVLGLPFPVHFAAAFLLFDIWMYWWHRLNHRVRFLWRFHRMHHSDPAMDVSTAIRFHPGEILLASVSRLALIPLIGIPLELIVAYDALQLAITQFHHANLSLPPTFDRAIRYVIVSPNMHKVHHSQYQPETDSNYCSVLSVWDRIFGSYREKPDYREIRFGLVGYSDDAHQSLRGMAVTPLHSG